MLSPPGDPGCPPACHQSAARKPTFQRTPLCQGTVTKRPLGIQMCSWRKESLHTLTLTDTKHAPVTRALDWESTGSADNPGAV